MEDQHQQFVQSLYRGLFQREADKEGLDHFVSLLSSGTPALEVYRLLANSEEAQEVWKRANPCAITNDQIANFMKSIGHDNIHIVDVGAQNLDYESHVYEPLRRYELSGKIIGFEPLFKKAQNRNEDENDVTIYPIALGTGDPETFHINNFDATSSIYPWNHDFINKFQGLGDFWTIEKMTIETTRLDEVPLPEPLGFLKLDVQGFELPILGNATETLRNTSVIFTEVEFQPIYRGQPLFADVDVFMRENDFELIDVINQVRMTPKTALHPFSENGVQLMWGDAIYMKRTNQCTPSMLLDQIAISALVFGMNTYATFLSEESERMFSENLIDRIRVS